LQPHAEGGGNADRQEKEEGLSRRRKIARYKEDDDMTGGGSGQVTGLTKNRVEALTDGIFAFAMTLLVTTLDFPNSTTALPPLTVSSLVSLYSPDLLQYVIAFAALAGFWVTHHIHFSYIRVMDRTALWINIACLFFVALLPFSTALSGDYPDTPLAAMVFEVNLLVIGLIILLIWNYATVGRRLVEKSLDEKVVLLHARRSLIIPVISVIGILLALAGSTWSTTVYLLAVPFLLVIQRHS
jgi:uncharacterized membrane protein